MIWRTTAKFVSVESVRITESWREAGGGIVV